MRRVLILCLAPLCLALAARAEWPKLPPIEGELTGKFLMPGLPSAPPIDWKLDVRAGEKGRRHAELVADASGGRLRAHADLDAATGDGSWQIDESELDAAIWLSIFAGKLGDTFNAAEVSGKISVTGGGEIKTGSPTGTFVFALTEGRLALPKQKLEFTGLALRVALPLPQLTAKCELTFAAGRAASFELSEGRIACEFDDQGGLQVSEARARGLGGAIAVAPFRFQLAQPDLAMTTTLAGIDLDRLAAYLPPALSEAHGRVDGELVVRWSQADGLGFGAGWMRLTEGTPAMVRLAPTPGLITAQLGVGNPAFLALQRVELGQTPLKVQLLSAEFQPAGDALGRTATVHLEAAPTDPQLIAPILMEVNVSGPLDQLIKLGLDDHMRVGGPR